MPLALENRIAVVSGASRGIGRAVALELARQGAHVVALARTQGALEELDDEIRKTGGSVTLAPCDLKDHDALDRLGAALHERWGRLDILFANAGIMGPVTPLAHVDPPKWEEALNVNVTANFRLIRSLDPLLRASDAGRVVAISSGAGNKAELSAFKGVYAVSKAALDALFRTYAAETAKITNVRVTIVNPGYIRTQMRAALMPGEDPLTLPAPEDIAPALAALCHPQWQETGVLFDLREGKVKRFRGPA
ncbi:MAG: SDR family NAD(P)-dependent oxidoreductase [Alphaproteobacteria bacterium]|nr:SDR family NAD(P)-dependent oxidoreductase [Alphaproteobacteria bacterium]